MYHVLCIHVHVQCLIIIVSFRLNIVAVDFLGHGDSKAPNQPNLYTEEVSLNDSMHAYNSKGKCPTCSNRRESILSLIL